MRADSSRSLTVWRKVAEPRNRQMSKGGRNVYDVICVGFGPANIALAIALEELWPKARVKFLEKAPRPYWQPARLLDGVDVQNDPVRDLVTPRNAGSRYTFINYLHDHGPQFK